MELAPAFFATLATLVTVAGAFFTARRYSRMGGGAAQLQLNSTLKQTMDAQTLELGSLRRQLDDAQKDILEGASERKEMKAAFDGCKGRLERVERENADLLRRLFRLEHPGDA